MSTVNFRTTNGVLALDAFEAWNHPTTDAVVLRTDESSSDPKYDMTWSLEFQWNAQHEGQAVIVDAATDNKLGPNVLRIVPVGGVPRPVVQGRKGELNSPPPVPPAPLWTVEYAGNASDFSAVPVRLALPGMGYIGMGAPGAGMPVAISPSKANAAIWTLVPYDLVSSWSSTVVVATPQLTVQGMVTELWNKLEGTAWAGTFAPTLLWWMHVYPHWRTDTTRWLPEATYHLYNGLYVPYVVNGNSGWGSGNPPVARPVVGGGKPPIRR